MTSNLSRSVLLVFLATVLRFSAEAAVISVTTTGNSGPGSLRQAILDANATPGKDTITFNIPGGGPYIIFPASPLPTVTDSVVIDGTTQPGYAGQPIVGLIGSSAGSAHGLVVQANDSEVRALFINRFSGSGIQLSDGSGSVVAGCVISTNVSGVLISASRSNRIGGTNTGDRNILSGNDTGLWITGLGLSATGNVVQGNFIGTDATGDAAWRNGSSGVLLGAPGNIIGGTTAAERNLISGNGQDGVVIRFTTNNWVRGNFIGTKSNGTTALSNGRNGVTLVDSSRNLIGGSIPGAGNLISGNTERGIHIFRESGVTEANRVEGNLIGTDVTGRLDLGNGFNGVNIALANNNVIGGTNPAARNIISGNELSGVSIESNSVANVVLGNFIGLDAAGTNWLANSLSGISILQSTNNVIGGTNVGAGNVISGNKQNGVFLFSGAGTRVQGNLVGTDASGLAARGNGLTGVRIECPGNIIGGDALLARNILSGNTNSGVALLGTAASNNIVAGNFIGTDITGSAPLANWFYGVNVTNAPRNFIGTADPFGGNVISGNTFSSIYIAGTGASGNSVCGNFIGTDATGSFSIPRPANASNNLAALILSKAGTNFIGGTGPGAGNLLSGNPVVVISIDTANGNVIYGNFIGTRADGTTALPNFLHGIELLNTSSYNVIGGIGPGEGNRIANALSGGYDGVRVRDGCVGNVIRGNAMFGNGGSAPAGMGIDWSSDGPTTTNPLKFPTLTSSTGRYITTISGSLSGTASSSFILDFYGDLDLDPSLHGEGRRWIGAAVVNTTGAGTANFSIKFTNAVSVGSYVSATTTDAGGNTSEFSLTIPVTPSPDTDGDGLPDDYEMAFGLNPNSSADGHLAPTGDGLDHDLDSDGDGLSNYKEFLAGTKPNDPSSTFRIVLQRQADRTLIFVDSVEGSTYRVESATNVTGPWTILVDGKAGTDAMLRIADVPSPTRKFYRVSAN